MSISVQPLRISYSFVANRKQATDKVNLAKLDEAITLINDKLDEILVALDVTTNDDGTLKDGVIEGRHFSNDARDEITSIVRSEIIQP